MAIVHAGLSSVQGSQENYIIRGAVDGLIIIIFELNFRLERRFLNCL